MVGPMTAMVSPAFICQGSGLFWFGSLVFVFFRRTTPSSAACRDSASRRIRSGSLGFVLATASFGFVGTPAGHLDEGSNNPSRKRKIMSRRKAGSIFLTVIPGTRPVGLFGSRIAL